LWDSVFCVFNGASLSLFGKKNIEKSVVIFPNLNLKIILKVPVRKKKGKKGESEILNSFP